MEPLPAGSDAEHRGLDGPFSSRLHDELRALAAACLRRERRGHTLQPTALVHEAFLRLGGFPDREPDRARFLGLAAHQMRQILVQHARRRRALKRGGGAERLTLTGLDPAAPARETDLLALDEALEELARREQRVAQVVELRFFGGLDVAEVARELGVSRRTVEADWTFARAWLHRRLA